MKMILILFAMMACSAASAWAEDATVFIYRLRNFQGSARRMTLSLDGKPLAYLQNGRYLALTLPAGEHTLSDKRPDDFLKFTVEAGKTYYLRGEWLAVGNWGNFNIRFTVVDSATAEGDIRRLKTGDRSQIQN